VDGAPVLIDTGIALHREAILQQLSAFDLRRESLTVFLTRAEYDTVGNLGAIHSAMGVSNLLGGGAVNIYDGYNEVPGFASVWDRRLQLARVLPGEGIGIGAIPGRLLALSAPIRVLATHWVYDSETRTLFTSDMFGHALLSEPTASPVMESIDHKTGGGRVVKQHLEAKFAWLRDADTAPVAAALAEVFERRQVDVIAPAHGCVLRGRRVVLRHHELMQAALARRAAA
jgi:flavorubredoxin